MKTIGIFEKIEDCFLVGCIELGLYAIGDSIENAISNFKNGLAIDFFKTLSLEIIDDEIMVSLLPDNKIELEFLNDNYQKYSCIVKNNRIVHYYYSVNAYPEIKFYRNNNQKISMLIFFESMEGALEFQFLSNEFIYIPNNPYSENKKPIEYNFAINFIEKNIFYLNFIINEYLKVEERLFKVNKLNKKKKNNNKKKQTKKDKKSKENTLVINSSDDSSKFLDLLIK